MLGLKLIHASERGPRYVNVKDGYKLQRERTEPGGKRCFNEAASRKIDRGLILLSTRG